MHSFFIKLMRPACVIITLLALSWPGASTAAEAQAGPASLQPATLGELIDIGLRDNPGIKARRLAWKAAVERRPQATALEDPLLSYTQPIREIETRLGPNKRSIMLSQKFPFPGKLRVKGEIAAKEAEMARVALDSAARDLVLEIKKAYYDLYYLDEAIRFARERTNVFEHFSRAERNDYSVGVTGFSDVVSAETRSADAEYDLILLSELRRVAESAINTLLNRDLEEPITGVEKPLINDEVPELQTLYKKIERHEAVVTAGLSVRKSALAEELSGFTSRPNFTVGLNYTEIGDPAVAGLADGGRDAVAITFGVSLPIWAGRNNAARREASLARTGSEQARAAILNTLQARVKKAYVDMNSSYRLVRLYSDSLLPKAEKLIETAEIMYKNGKGSIADPLESRVMWINFSLAYHRAAANYLKNRAELERLTASYELKEGAIDE